MRTAPGSEYLGLRAIAGHVYDAVMLVGGVYWNISIATGGGLVISWTRVCNALLERRLRKYVDMG